MNAEQQSNESVEMKYSTPAWALKSLESHVGNIERISQLLNLSRNGIHAVCQMPELAETLAKSRHSRYSGDEGSTLLESLKKQAELAAREVKEDFPLLHSQVTIAIWSSIESTIHDFLATWLKNDKTAMGSDIVQKIKIKLGDYECLNEEEKCYFIVDKIEQEISSPTKNGIDRFEALFHIFKLQGNISKDLRRDLIELNQVRNALVHRGSADKRLVDTCPWLNLTVGLPLSISQEQAQRYLSASMEYCRELVLRTYEYFGDDTSQHRLKNSN